MRQLSTLFLCILELVVLLLLPIGCSDSGNYAAGASRPATDSNASVSPNPEMQTALSTSCFDCHSNEKPSSWNVRLAPSYLFGAGKARRALNFSQWQSYGVGERHIELARIAKTIEDGSMPPGDYSFVHPAGKLSPNSKQVLLDWIAVADSNSR